jgi:ABC-2 type transport system permease protein
VVIHRRYNPESGHRLQHRARPAGRHPVHDPGDDDRAQRHARAERGTMESLLATPVEPIEVMVGKLAPYVASA